MMRWNSAKTYTEEDMLRMQQEAMDRVREFQQRTRAATGLSAPSWLDQGQPEPILQGEPLALTPVSQEEPEELQPQTQEPSTGAQSSAPPLEGLLERLGMDGETVLILGLILLLYNEKADHLLLLALAYLLF